MFCCQCSAELADDSKVCAKCGASVDHGTATSPPFSPPEPLDYFKPVAPAPAALTNAAAPYAAFASLVLGFGLCLSVVMFNAAHSLAHGYWRVSPFSLLATGVAVVLMLLMPRTWRRIEACPDEQGYHKKLLNRCAILVPLFMAIAATVGAAVGKSGSETADLLADLHEMTEVGNRITQARSHLEPTVPARIVMYKQIEPDVQLFAAVLLRLQAEYSTFDDKFPSQHARTLKGLDSINIGLKRAALLQQQIAVAREIETMDPAPRLQAWKERMQPLLDAEASLNKN